MLNIYCFKNDFLLKSDFNWSKFNKGPYVKMNGVNLLD